MKFKINKKYKTRDGHTARIMRIRSGSVGYPLVGKVKFGDHWSQHIWTSEGKRFHNTEDIFDLVKAKKCKKKQ